MSTSVMSQILCLALSMILHLAVCLYCMYSDSKIKIILLLVPMKRNCFLLISLVCRLVFMTLADYQGFGCGAFG